MNTDFTSAAFPVTDTDRTIDFGPIVQGVEEAAEVIADQVSITKNGSVVIEGAHALNKDGTAAVSLQVGAKPTGKGLQGHVGGEITAELNAACEGQAGVTARMGPNGLSVGVNGGVSCQDPKSGVSVTARAQAHDGGRVGAHIGISIPTN